MGSVTFDFTGASSVTSVISGLCRKESLLLNIEESDEDEVEESLLATTRWRGCLMLKDLDLRGFGGFEGLDDFTGIAGFAKVFV